MASDRILEPLDVIEHICFCLVPGAMDFARGALGLQRREGALHRRVVPDIAGSAHAADGAANGRHRARRVDGEEPSTGPFPPIRSYRLSTRRCGLDS